MVLVELPIQIGLRIHHPVRPLREDHVAVEIGKQGRGAKTARNKVSQLVESEQRYRLTVSAPWDLPHDFRKVFTEVVTMSRLLSDVSTLLAVLIDSEERVDYKYSVITEKAETGLRRIKPMVIEHLLNGRSIDELPNASGLRNSRIERDLLVFETLMVSIESPFFAKLKAYLRWDKKVNVGQIVQAATLGLALSTQLQGDYHPPVTTAPQITWQVGSATSQSSDAIYRRSLGEYQAELRAGGIKTAQKYLFMLGYNPGLFDGKDGPETENAVATFCDDQRIASQDIHSPIFLRQLAEAVAKKFPIHGPK